MALSKFSLDGKTAVITGAGRGIGKGIALAFAEAGADVVIAETEPSTARITANEIKNKGGNALVVMADVTNSAQVDSLTEAVLKEFGRIDVLVNNVGSLVNIQKPLLELKEAEWEFGLGANLKSTFLCCKAVGKVMKNQRSGSIINISSISGIQTYSVSPCYSIAKAGVIHLTLNLALELGPYNVRVNTIAPGATLTPTLEERIRANPEIKSQRLSATPLGRLGTPEDQAMAAVYLASDASSWVTGEVLIVGGGMHITYKLDTWKPE